MYYLAVVGSREFWNKAFLFDTLDKYIKDNKLNPVTIVSGGAKGADSLAALYAKERHINLIEYLPDWSLGRHAGFLRNEKIIEKADYIVACLIHGLPCKGTRNSISIAEKSRKPLNIIYSQQRPPVIRTPHVYKGS